MRHYLLQNCSFTCITLRMGTNTAPDHGDGITISGFVPANMVQLYLLGAYYVFDMQYPREYSQIHGFIQQTVVGQPYIRENTKGFGHELANYFPRTVAL